MHDGRARVVGLGEYVVAQGVGEFDVARGVFLLHDLGMAGGVVDVDVVSGCGAAVTRVVVQVAVAVAVGLFDNSDADALVVVGVVGAVFEIWNLYYFAMLVASWLLSIEIFIHLEKTRILA